MTKRPECPADPGPPPRRAPRTEAVIARRSNSCSARLRADRLMRSASRVIGEQCQHRVGEGCRILRWHEQTGDSVIDDLWRAADRQSRRLVLPPPSLPAASAKFLRSVTTARTACAPARMVRASCRRRGTSHGDQPQLAGHRSRSGRDGPSPTRSSVNVGCGSATMRTARSSVAKSFTGVSRPMATTVPSGCRVEAGRRLGQVDPVLDHPRPPD